MRQNYETCIVGNKVILVPYRPQHVKIYHEWMKDPYLLEMTGSEPLSFKDELEMQKSWRMDETKCTFILLAKEDCIQLVNDEDDGDLSLVHHDEMNDFVMNNLDAMVGDVNLFLSEEDDDDDDNEEEEENEHDSFQNEDNSKTKKPLQAEIDIMVAVEKYRQKGIGKEAVCLMMMYAATNLGIRCIKAKIKDTNDASRKLFEKSLGFRESNFVSCFKEYEYELKRESPHLLEKAIHELYPREIRSHDVPIYSCDKNDPN